MARPKSSYRLGRRLKAGAKARRDYITYLQSGSDKRNRRSPEIPGRVSMRFALGGNMVADIAAFTRQFIGALMNGAGEQATNVAIRQELSVDYPGGGNFRMNIFPPVTFAAKMDLGGNLMASVSLPVFISALNQGGGTLGVNVGNPMLVGAVIQGGGAMATNVSTESLFDPDAQAVIDAMSVTPSATRQELINTLVVDLKANDLWDKFDALYIHAAHDEQAARINWRKPSVPEISGVLTFIPNIGIKRSGTVLTCGYGLADYTPVYSNVNAHMGVYIADNDVATTAVRVQTSAGTPRNTINARTSSPGADINGNSITVTSQSSAQGTWIVTDNDTNVELYRNGVLIGSSTSSASTEPTDDVELMPLSSHVATQAVTHWGSYLTPTEMGEFQAILEDYLADIKVSNIIAAMTNPPDETEQVKINTLVETLSNAGIWAKLDLLYLFKRDEQAALINWVNPDEAGVNNGCTFGATTGFTRNSGAQFVGLPFPTAGVYGQNNAAAGVYYSEVGATDNRILSTNRTGGSFLTLTLRSTPDMQGALNDGTADTRARSTGNGLYSVVRTSASNKVLYKGGVAQGSAFTTASTGVPVATTLKVFDSAVGSTGTAKAAFMGKALSAGELTTLETAINDFFT